MFTGLVQAVGEVVGLDLAESGVRLRVTAGDWSHRSQPGESIAVSGCCLTVAGLGEGEARALHFDVVHQTMRLTGLGGLREGDRVNLEHAATPETLLGGHLVQGHVDGVGSAWHLESSLDGERRIRVEPPPELLDCISPRGSITLDGVSLTIAQVGPDWFDVALIPTTLGNTTLDRIDAPTPVNIETDCMVKAVIHYLKRQGVGTPTNILG